MFSSLQPIYFLLYHTLTKLSYFTRVAKRKRNNIPGVDVCDATGHSGREVPTDCSQNDNTASCHVLTSVIAHAFNNRSGPGIPDSKSFATDTTEEGSS